MLKATAMTWEILGSEDHTIRFKESVQVQCPV
jgi:hypothetical protein